MFLHRLCATVTFTHAHKFVIIINKLQRSACEAEHFCVWALTHLLSFSIPQERIKTVKTLFH